MSASAARTCFRVEPLSAPAATRLVCFPPAGGTLTCLTAWAEALSSHIELWRAVPPEREFGIRQPVDMSFDEVVASWLDCLGPRSDRDFILYGHSMGGAVAFELSQRLAERWGRPPVALIVSGCRAPSLLAERRARVSQMSDSRLIELLLSLGGTPPEVLEDEELRPLICDGVRSDYAVLESYCYRERAPLDCPVHVVCGRSDPETTPDRVRPWQKETTHQLRIHELPGGHFFVNERASDLLGVISAIAGRPLRFTRPV